MKRHAPAEFDDVDSENIDPIMMFSSSNKKAKAFDFDTSKLTKAPMFTLASTNPVSKRVDLPQIAGHKRKGDDEYAGITVKRQEPSPAPAPAGRSPKQKHKGILSRRRFTTNPFTRVDPPCSTTSSLPFSIDAAIAGTVSSVKAKSKAKPSSKGWHFEIHEDTPDDEMTNLMEHSTCTLDISDDEGRNITKEDRENKENIAPIDYHTAGNSPVSRRDVMTEEVRSPLGDLDAKAFYGEGCDDSSVFVVPGDEPNNNNMQAHVDDNVDQLQGGLVSEDADSEGQADWNAASPDPNAKAGLDGAVALEHEASEIQIWESESAKAEDETNGLDELPQ